MPSVALTSVKPAALEAKPDEKLDELESDSHSLSPSSVEGGDEEGQSLVSDPESDSLDNVEPRKRRRRTSDEKDPIKITSAFSVPSRIKRPQTQDKPQGLGGQDPKKLTADDHAPTDPARWVTAPLDVTTSFASLRLSPWLVQALANMAIKYPTTIQRECIPQILAGRDCIGGSRTGSGKTLAFAAPILQRLHETPSAIFAVVMTPTRELALQIYEQFRGFSPQTKLLLVTGGSDMRPQAIALARKPHVVICTPGRLADHIRTAAGAEDFGLRRVRFVVLDEADRLLAAGDGDGNPSLGSMLPDVEECLSALPPAAERQTLLFTATMTPEVRALRSLPRAPGRAPVFVCEVDASAPAVPPTLRQTHVQVPVTHREHYLHVLLSTPGNVDRATIVFCNRASTADFLHRLLRLLGHRVAALHSGLPQRSRTDALARFRAGAARILVATDVAARGLDIPEVALVVNYDVPRDPDAYVHRVGRTARAGRRGDAVTLVGQRDVDLVLAVEARAGRPLEAWREEGVNLETRVLRDALKPVSEKKREALLEMEEGKEAGGKRKRGKLRLRAE